MITEEEYRAAKAIVNEYEALEFEMNQRQADEDTNIFDQARICDCCGCDDDDHAIGCPEDNSPYAMLCRQGYD